MRAAKENREYAITEADVESFVNEGYDIYDDRGKIIRYGKGKVVPFDTYAQLTERFEALMEENAVLTEENVKLKADLKKKAPRTKKAEKEE